MKEAIIDVLIFRPQKLKPEIFNLAAKFLLKQVLSRSVSMKPVRNFSVSFRRAGPLSILFHYTYLVCP